jgi:hypothetical protein
MKVVVQVPCYTQARMKVVVQVPWYTQGRMQVHVEDHAILKVGCRFMLSIMLYLG